MLNTQPVKNRALIHWQKLITTHILLAKNPDVHDYRNSTFDLSAERINPNRQNS